MKKILAFATMALMVVAAQALQVSWTNAGASIADNGNANASNFTLTLVATASNGLSTGDKVLLNTITIGLRTNAAPSASMIYLGSTSSDVPTADQNNTKLSGTGVTGATIAVSPTRTVDAITYTFAGDGIELVVGEQYDLTIVAPNYKVYKSNGAGFPIAESKESDQVLSRGSDTWGPVYTITATVIEETENPGENVPEPTCLALLALGVAGLALKRKMK